MSEILPIYLITNKKHHFLLPGFIYLFQKYWSNNQPINIFSYGEKDSILNRFLPDHFNYVSLGNDNLPVNRWSNGVLFMLDQIREDFFILLLEDFWLNSPVNLDAVMALYRYCNNFPDRDRMLRMDLTRDRASRGYTDWGSIDQARIILSNRSTAYQVSFQAGIWNRENLRIILQPAESPWEAEIKGTERFQKSKHLRSMFNLGTLDYPVKYRPVYRAGQKRLDLSSLDPVDKVTMQNKRMILYPKGTAIKWD